MKVFIAEAMPSANRGESAILWGISEAMNDSEPCRFGLCTSTAEHDAHEYGHDVALIVDNVVTAGNVAGRILQAGLLLARHMAYATLRRMHPGLCHYIMRAPLWHTYEQSDVILLGHDNVLVGRMLFNICGVVLVARALSKPTVVYAGTVGPFSDALTRYLTGWLLRRVDLVTLREERSLTTTLELIGSRGPPVHVATDPAFLMPPISTLRVQEILAAEGVPETGILIGFTTTSDMAQRYAVSHGLTPSAYLRDRARLADYLTTRYSARVLLIPHCVEGHVRRDDRVVNAYILEHITRSDRVYALPGSYTARELKGVIGRCCLLVGERTHSMIAAASLAVPIVGIASRVTGTKTRGILGTTCGLNDWILDVETLKPEDLQDKVDQALFQCEVIRAKLLAKLDQVLELARSPGVLTTNLVRQAVSGLKAHPDK